MSNVICRGVFCVLWVLLRSEMIVRSVDINGIDDHHCLIFFFPSRSGWQLWNIHISNDNGSFPFYIYIFFSPSPTRHLYICMSNTGVFSRKSKRSWLDPLILRIQMMFFHTNETLWQKRWFQFSHCELSIYIYVVIF